MIRSSSGSLSPCRKFHAVDVVQRLVANRSENPPALRIETKLNESSQHEWPRTAFVIGVRSERCWKISSPTTVSTAKTWSRCERYVRKHLQPTFEIRKAENLTKQDVTDYMAEMLKSGYSNATINRCVALLRRAFRLADVRFPRVDICERTTSRLDLWMKISFGSCTRSSRNTNSRLLYWPTKPEDVRKNFSG